MSVNVHFLPTTSWPSVARAVRAGALGVLVAAVLALPFPVASQVGGKALTPPATLADLVQGAARGDLAPPAPLRGANVG